MADVFDNQVDAAWRDDLWTLIRECQDLDWLLLTKRPQNIADMLPTFWEDVKASVWLGTTVEDQKRADQNIPHLLKQDSAVRFLSCEPMVGPIDLMHLRYSLHGYGPLWAEALTGWTRGAGHGYREADLPNKIDWVIAGGESGPSARVADPDWFRQLRNDCAAHDVPFLFKQWGNWDENMRHVRDKKVAGRLLDGVTHDGYPVLP
jgi:protein gp37